MNLRSLLYWLLMIISGVTLVSGAVQMLDPGFVLKLLAAEVTPATDHLFGIVGMFMVLFGGMLLQVLLSKRLVAPVYLWAGLQKLGASASVALGVARHLFCTGALLISGFDLLSGLFILLYLGLLKQERQSV